MGKVTKNSDGTYSMNGFSNKNPADMEAVKEACFSEKFKTTEKPVEKKAEEKPVQKPKKKA